MGSFSIHTSTHLRLASCSITPVRKSLFQHHSSKSSVLQCSAFFTVQLSHPCMTTGKTTAARRASLFVANSWNLLKLMSIESVMPSSVVPFSSCLQSFPASGSFPVGQFFASGGQSIGVSASASVLPMNTQDWSPLGWTGWISLQCTQRSDCKGNDFPKVVRGQ